eukprot:TRINITY_DN14767_c0_g3_i4.p1 TRINITY_DN14767_c0_g3~~TRINITY_DN14767_c0_g3_i4.p1  ORF type:complete len:878 (+),score=208.77 TRINITY_DN14767_c0_g3_i4:58-2691(+)
MHSIGAVSRGQGALFARKDVIKTVKQPKMLVVNVAELERQTAVSPADKEVLNYRKANEVPKIEQEIVEKLEFVAGGSRYEITPRAAYEGAAWSLRERLFESFNKTHKVWREKDPKFVYYLSAEFLMGRSFLNTVFNLDLGKEYTEALNKIGYEMETVVEQERDAALGNGGLGRLAACFLDSIATLNYPGWGYGIRYRYGMFKQGLQEGKQTEMPDIWLQGGNPWELERRHVCYPVGFFGVVDADGKWTPEETVIATAYDNPIPGYNTQNTTNLRLWDARPIEELDLDAFNAGDYIESIEGRRMADAIVSVLYPNDATAEGKLLRLKQQYFFVTASLQDVIARYKADSRHGDLTGLPDKACFQLNDTHPTISIAEMMRLLVDVEGLSWDSAWDITRKCHNYTNHTVMPEALEKWPVQVIEQLLPRHMQIIERINKEWLEHIQNKYKELDEEDVQQKLDAVAVIQRNPWIRPSKVRPKKGLEVNMAYLAVVGSSYVNGVAAIHSDIIKETIFNDFIPEFAPDKFQNKTNGVTPRRWLAYCNPALTSLITETLGTNEWIQDMSMLQKLQPLANDPDFRKKWRDVKWENKRRLAAVIKQVSGDEVNLDAMFDIQIKRIHEYKRQLLNCLSIMWRYKQLKKMSPSERSQVVPRVSVVGGKAASAYDMAKRIIRLVTSVGEVINNDPDTKDYLRLYFLPDYNVSIAEKIIPAAELSQHISTGGTEASGTSNMKFQMNGSLIIGTMDGANIEIAEEAGKDNLFIFGVDAKDVPELRKERADFETDPRWQELMQDILEGKFGDKKYFKPLVQSVDDMNVGNDWFLVANDFASYLEAQEEVDKIYKDQDEWTRRSIIYTATSGKFNSDRTIKQYADEIWHISPCKI